MALHLKYQGRETQDTRTERSYKQTWQGTEAEIDAKVAQLSIGTLYQGKGYLDNLRKHQGQGVFWELQAEYKVTCNNNSPNDDGSTVVGKKSATLSVRNIQMPLEHLPNYKTKWNYYLIGLGSNSLPAWAETASNSMISISDRTKYQWIKNISEMPLDPDANGKYWRILQKPTKPGVEYYDWSVFTISISAKYNTASAAGQAVSKNINHIVTPSETFGLTGGNWKLDEVSISYDGKHWISNQTYTKSGDSNGWDTDIYN